MIGSDRYRAVNWIDGMKVSRHHFVQTNQYVADQVRTAVSDGLSLFNYGVLPFRQSGTTGQFNCLVSGDIGQNIHVEVLECNALTPDGSRIAITSENEITYTITFTELAGLYQLSLTQAHFFYVVLSVNLFQSTPLGEPDVNELPPRHPFVLPEHSIQVIPVQHVVAKQWGANHLIVAKIAYADNELRMVEDYIPACTCVSSLPILKNWHERFGGYLNEIETFSYRIVRKIKLKSQKSTLSDSVQALAEGLVRIISALSGTFRWIIPDQSPIHLVIGMIQVTERIKVEMEFLTDRDKEELLNYLAEWADVSPGAIHSQLYAVIQVSYSHIDSSATFQVIESFFSMWTALFSKLSQLEFIGKRKGQQVFIIESPVHETPPVAEKMKSRWSPI